VKKVAQMLLMLVTVQAISANSLRQSEDLKKIYLYTMIVFMHQLNAEYQQASSPPQLWTVLQLLHKQRIGFSVDRLDYTQQDSTFEQAILAHFTQAQQQRILQDQLNSVNSMPGQLLAYELIYKEHPLGSGYHFLPSDLQVRVRLQKAFGSKELATFFVEKEAVWGEYLNLWMMLVRSRYGEFQQLMDLHIHQFNQQ
jgi:hypothetical protein